MFRTLINDAKSAAGAVIGKYVIRASVAVPFVVAAGFGTAATTLVLIDRFGAVIAYCLMAGGFAAVGLFAALAVTVKEQEEVVGAQAEKTDTANVATDAAAQAAVQLPLALLGTLLTSPMGPGVAAGGAKMVVRHLPLVLLIALIGLLFWPSADEPAEGEIAEPNEGAAESSQPEWQQARNGVDRHAA